MTRNRWFLHGDRVLEARVLRVMTTFEIWIYEDERPIARHSIVRLGDVSRALTAGRDLLGQALDSAIADTAKTRFDATPMLPALEHAAG